MSRHQEDLSFAFLSPSEQRRIKEEAAGDPAREAVIEDSRRLHELVISGVSLDLREMDDLLAALALPGRDASATSWRGRILERLNRPENDPIRDRVSETLDHLEGSVHAAEHFERLTGHPVSPPSSSRRLWMAAAVVAVAILAHGTFERITEDPVKHEVWSQWEPPRPTRDGGFGENEVQRARRMGYESRSSILGLWPTYDMDQILRADTLLEGRQDPVALIERVRLQAMAGRLDLARLTLASIPEGAVNAAEMAALRAVVTPPVVQ